MGALNSLSPESKLAGEPELRSCLPNEERGDGAFISALFEPTPAGEEAIADGDGDES